MPFPFSARGKVSVDRVDGGDVSSAMSAVENALRDARASAIKRDSDSIAFRGGMFRLVTNWNILAPISSGLVRFERAGHSMVMRYRISFVQMFVAVTVLLTALKMGSWPWGSHGARVPLGALLFFWCWLFGANYVIALIRFPAFLRRAVEAEIFRYADPHATRNV